MRHYDEASTPAICHPHHRIGRLARRFAVLAVACLAGTSAVTAAPTAQRVAGSKPGLWYWTLPTTPNKLKPVQSWSGAAAAPNGDIYVGGMNHVDNAALYRLTPTGGDATKPGRTLTYVGDAKAASQAARNWQAGEPIEKFHTQPVWQGTKIYVANLNYSELDDGYLARRGFHWYGYDWNKGGFRDLSATEPGGVAAAHGGLLSLVVDRNRNRIYGTASPTGDIYAYDIAKAKTTLLGRPAYGRPYVYAGRAMWASSAGRIYFTAGTNKTGPKYGGPYDPAIFNHVHYYDPVTGFGEETDWALHDQRAIDSAQCFGSPRTCYLMDNVGHVYRYAEQAAAAASWTYLGSVGQNQDEKYGYTWVFHVRPDQKKAYILARRGQFFEFDVASGTAKPIVNLYTREPKLLNHDFYGYNAWDAKGRFYFTAFPKPGFTPQNTKLVAIDPAQFVASAKTIAH